MAGKSTAHANSLLDFEFRAVAYTPPATRYFALMTADPTDAGGGTEASYTGYARQGVLADAASWAAAASKKTSNVNAIVFPVLPAATTVVVSTIAVYDALTAGNLIEYKVLDSDVTFTAGQAPQIAAGFWEVTD